jgi:hypothetical protein
VEEATWQYLPSSNAISRSSSGLYDLLVYLDSEYENCKADQTLTRWCTWTYPARASFLPTIFSDRSMAGLRFSAPGFHRLSCYLAIPRPHATGHIFYQEIFSPLVIIIIPGILARSVSRQWVSCDCRLSWISQCITIRHLDHLG